MKKFLTAKQAIFSLLTFFAATCFCGCFNRGVQVVPTPPSPTAGLVAKVTTYAVSNSGPLAIAANQKGDLFVNEINSFNIDEIAPGGGVSIYAGTSTSGSTSAQRLTSSFNSLLAITADPFGNVFVSDDEGTVIKEIAADGAVSIFAGQAGVSRQVNSTGKNAAFQSVNAMTCDASGNLFVLDAGAVRKITQQAAVTTLLDAGSLNNPGGIAVDAIDNLFISNSGANNIVELTVDLHLNIVAGSGQPGKADGIGTQASFNNPLGITVAPNDIVYVIDGANNLLRIIDNAGNAGTLAGGGSPADTDGVGTFASFSDPKGITIDQSGNLYITEFTTGHIRKVVIAYAY
jgi:hypothetical protein